MDVDHWKTREVRKSALIKQSEERIYYGIIIKLQRVDGGAAVQGALWSKKRLVD